MVVAAVAKANKEPIRLKVMVTVTMFSVLTSIITPGAIMVKHKETL